MAKPLIVEPNFLDFRTCRRIIREAEDSDDFAPAPVGGPKTVQPKIRKTSRLIPPEGTSLRKLIDGVVERAFFRFVQPRLPVEVGDAWEEPQLLRYDRGDYYKVHRDAGAPFDYRMASIVIHLNSDCTGGALGFPDLRTTVSPREGQLIAFRATERHAVRPTKNGRRWALVTWTRRTLDT